jgi:DNA-binding response OmpR family regulator
MGAAAVEQIVAGNLIIRPGEFLAHVDGRVLALTVRELSLLVALARRAGCVVSRAELYRVVWRQPYRPYERSVDVYVGRLRQKLEAAAPDWRYIHTHFGFGYRFDAQPVVVTR